MRDIIQVIGEIRNALPPYVDTTRLESIEESARYATPETIYLWWAQLSDWINSIVPIPPREDWHIKVAAILTNLPEEDLVRVYGRAE